MTARFEDSMSDWEVIRSQAQRINRLEQTVRELEEVVIRLDQQVNGLVVELTDVRYRLRQKAS